MIPGIEISASVDGKITLIRMPYSVGAAEIMRSCGARWRKSLRAWAVPVARAGDAECRLPALRALMEHGGRTTKSPTPISECRAIGNR
jgi:hypothetical protein